MTSGVYGYRMRQSIALAYVRTDRAVPGTVLYVEILGERRRAVDQGEKSPGSPGPGLRPPGGPVGGRGVWGFDRERAGDPLQACRD